METETLSTYEQMQDKHVLDASKDINIPRSDEENDLHPSKDVNADSGIGLKDIHDNAEGPRVRYEPSENKENENSTSVPNNHLTNNIDSDNGTDAEDEKVDNEKETIESEETNKSEKAIDEESSSSVAEDPLSEEERELSNSEENDPLANEEKSPVSNEENSRLNDEEKGSLSNEENDPLNNENDPLSVEEKDPLSHEEELSGSEEHTVEKDLINNESGAEECTTEKDLINDAPCAEEHTKDKDLTNNAPFADEHTTEKDLILGVSVDEDVESKSREGKGKDTDDCNVSKEVEKKPATEEESKKETEEVTNEKNDVPTNEDHNKTGEHSIETHAESKEHSEDAREDKNEDVSKDCPLLKETLTKARNEDSEHKEADGENGMEDIEMDDDFDPSLLCPDIAMEVDEAPVITNSDNVPSDGNKSPLLYEPIFSTYVDEMTGAEVSFNLTPEEQQLRQETYGQGHPIQYTRVHCTACNVHLGSALDAQSNRFVHPLLKVLICKDCYHFYTSGEFEKDEDGSELYCRWCGQGGQVICCSSCEMVFCKKCIRINFGRKKLTEIRDSEEWLCFRCDTSQLTALRVHCAEFMEYVRREISRAATLENATSFTTTDYTQCCLSQKKKYVEPHPSEPKKKKRKSSINDPDYDPRKDQPSPPPPSTLIKPEVNTPVATTQKPVPILPKPMDPSHNTVVVTQVGQNSQVFKVGSTIFRPRASQFSQPRPRVQVISPVTSSPVVRPLTSGPGYIKIMPGGIRVPPSPTRNQPAQTFVSPSSRGQPSFQQRASRPLGNTNNQMKHEWFEKTVRAAARVNSNLSYTLTQLNRAQATAASVEALAVVHNKLQEILSTSINSLIQIRKNLRTEFIAGIKNIRFPPKPPQPQPSTSAQDDDVIFVSPTASPVPTPLLTSSNAIVPPLTSITLPPSVSLTKRVSTPLGPSITLEPLPSTSRDNNDEKPKVFLRVKSLTALQNVPSECITIPDDPLPPPPPLTPIQKIHDDVTIIENSPEKNDVSTVIQEEKSIDEKALYNNVEKSNAETTDITNGDKEQDSHSNDEDGKENKSEDASLSFNFKDAPAHDMKKMLNTKVYITRSEEIDELVKRTFGLTNGNVSE